MNANSKTARIAGVLYLTIILSGIFAQFFVRDSLIEPGDATATATNIVASESLFRVGIAADLIMILCDVALAAIFYVLLKPVDNGLALLAAFFRLVQAAILGMNLLNLFLALQLVDVAEHLSRIWRGSVVCAGNALPRCPQHRLFACPGLLWHSVSRAWLSHLPSRATSQEFWAAC